MGDIMKRKIIVILCILMTIGVLNVGCSNIKDTKDNKDIVHIEPSKLFKGEAKILEPHLGIIGGGAVKVNIKQDNSIIRTSYEIWEDGNLVTSRDSFSSYIYDKEFNSEVTVSLKEDIEEKDMFKLTIAIDGHGSLKTKIPRFNKEYGWATNELHKEVNVPLDQEIAVWSLIANGRDKFFENTGNIEEDVKKEQWAFVLKLKVNERDKESDK